MEMIQDPEENYVKAVVLVRRDKRPSASYIQRNLEIGYNQAARIVERMEKEGIVTEANHIGKREVIEHPARDTDNA